MGTGTKDLLSEALTKTLSLHGRIGASSKRKYGNRRLIILFELLKAPHKKKEIKLLHNEIYKVKRFM